MEYLSKYPLDLILVPLSLFLLVGYHTYIWFSSKADYSSTVIGATLMKRMTWAQLMMQHKDRQLPVQSLRNSLMSAILSATIAIAVSTCLAALVNNAFNASHFLQSKFFGSQTGPTTVLKFASALLVLLTSFFTNSMSIGFIIEACFLFNAPDDLYQKQAQQMLKRGYVLATIGNRVLYVAVPILLWLFGPVAMALASVMLVLVFYNLDIRNIGFKKSDVLTC